MVDSDCKVHAYKNLFVCDASVFPNAVGVNPQITVMGVASIIASRIIRDWKSKYADIPLSYDLGSTCSRLQPMYCLTANLSDLFNTTSTPLDLQTLVNSADSELGSSNWEFNLSP